MVSTSPAAVRQAWVLSISWYGHSDINCSFLQSRQRHDLPRVESSVAVHFSWLCCVLLPIGIHSRVLSVDPLLRFAACGLVFARFPKCQACTSSITGTIMPTSSRRVEHESHSTYSFTPNSQVPKNNANYDQSTSAALTNPSNATAVLLGQPMTSTEHFLPSLDARVVGYQSSR